MRSLVALAGEAERIRLAREIARAGRRGEDCSLILLDVDRFKSINDGHGHQVADDVLRRVGRMLAQRAAPRWTRRPATAARSSP